MTRGPCEIRDLGRGVLVLLLAALPASLCRAEPARPPDPFADLDAIDVRLEIGGPLDLEGSTAPELFAGDVVRFNRFESAVERSVGTQLESCGILWDQGAVDEVTIFVFGRLEQQRDGPPLYVYMVEVEVLNSELRRDRTPPEPVPLRSVIGVAASADAFEAAIVEAAIAIISDELRSCK